MYLKYDICKIFDKPLNAIKKIIQKTAKKIPQPLKDKFISYVKKIVKFLNKFTPAFFDIAVRLIFILVVSGIIMTFFFRSVTVKGFSMTDTLDTQDKLIISTFSYTPQNGDIVVITHGAMYREPIIKRVIATEGQSVSIDYFNGDVIVDGVIINEKYAKGRTIQLSNPTVLPMNVPEGYVFVMGDNREGSSDSRTNRIGIIPVENIIGKAIFRIYPLNKFGLIY